MTAHADGSATCDRCGADIGNAGLDKCAVISLIVDPGDRVLNLHLCSLRHRLPEAREGTPDPEHCSSRVLTVRALAHYVENVDEPGEGVTPYTPPPPPEPAPAPDSTEEPTTA